MAGHLSYLMNRALATHAQLQYFMPVIQFKRRNYHTVMPYEAVKGGN